MTLNRLGDFVLIFVLVLAGIVAAGLTIWQMWLNILSLFN